MVLIKRVLSTNARVFLTCRTLKIQLDSPKFKDKVLNYILKTITTVFKTVLLTQLEKELQTYIGSVIHFGAALH